MSKEPETGMATERLKREMHGAVDNLREDLDRIEILASALAAFSQPIPEYEPRFQHLRHLTASVGRI